MGRKDDPRPPLKSKLTFMLIQLESADETLQQSLRTISQALAGNVQPLRLAPAKPVESSVSAPSVEEDSGANGTEVIETATEDQEEKPAKPSRPRMPPKSPVVLDLDFSKAKKPLKQFLDEKNPGDSNAGRYLAIAYWYKHSFATSEVTADHIHTAFKLMGWQTPKDASHPLRVLKSKKQWLGKGTGEGGYVINHVGENEVDKMGKGK
jgi:hypothetical protein